MFEEAYFRLTSYRTRISKVTRKSKDLQVSNDKEEFTRVIQSPWQNNVYQKIQEGDRQSQQEKFQVRQVYNHK